MKYIIPIIILSLFLLGCKAEEEEATSSTTELEGTWVKSCYLHESGGTTYYMIESLTISGTNWEQTYEYHSDSSCATDVGKFTYTNASLSIGGAITWDGGGTGHKYTVTRSDVTYTSQSSSDVSWCNTNSWCQLTGWELNTPQSTAGKTCAGIGTMYSNNTTLYGVYKLDGSALYWGYDDDDYPATLTFNSSTVWNKQ